MESQESGGFLIDFSRFPSRAPKVEVDDGTQQVWPLSSLHTFIYEVITHQFV